MALQRGDKEFQSGDFYFDKQTTEERVGHSSTTTIIILSWYRFFIAWINLFQNQSNCVLLEYVFW
jgi:hypothetical protein